ncbi:MAG: hypothetical protein FJ272_00765 [Planctomycetes bacterium]|nr:hypothetical protein [Planctomycetota bacterium]
MWIPIIHTEADLGSMKASVRRLYVRRAGERGWDRRVKAVEDIWRTIRAQVQALKLDYSRVRLYQDGLPNCGHEPEIVKGLAQSGSQNHQLLQELMEKGATVMGTESPELLLEEYQLARKTLGTLGASQPDGQERLQRERSLLILEKRDRYIAERISQTLKPGETGVLFLGMLHSLDGLLPQEVEVTCLGQIPRPPQRTRVVRSGC